jgi:hypothetical protein
VKDANEDGLRILTWNINHRSGEKAIPAALPKSILSMNPDIVVLTEYVEGPDHSNLCDSLEAGGLPVRFYSQKEAGQNQVFVALRFAATVGLLGL